jgi:hypothetical protein
VVDTLEGARELAQGFMNARFQNPANFETYEKAMTKPYGWVFFYQSRRFMETGNKRYRVAGNAPILVLKDGTVRELGTAEPLEWYLAEYE